MSKLIDLIPQGATLVGVEPKDWPAAIRAAAQPLIHNGCIEPAYVDAMIGVVEEHGPYIVIAPGFALAHAQASEHVHATSLSWCNLATPIEFGHKNDPVDVVVVLAAQDTGSHRAALKALAALLQDAGAMKRIRTAESGEDLRDLLLKASDEDAQRLEARQSSSADGRSGISIEAPSDLPASKGKILTVCGNGLGTSLFLKNTLEQVLAAWGWASLFTVEATDTISAKGKASDADCILTSGEIARTLGDLGVPMCIIENFTSEAEIDAALREIYWIGEE
ncbi:PTS sugar transporter subunit IIA [Corynebacterium pelargi]|uniref:Ascorbate-specific PTS system EIIA component n=1 Tax=Corynebacterium pelargi TaxID=1471400 RepID=A0A410W870_9CORY|nr:PTS sugar transporter subunit IIA [Corynebacterium pelargi]QAU52152.1 Ascorbate-specific phosphotransferase enzyme IIA component [Corynebacterium pelargi]GGG69784.1 PTS sugar transporter [Corynebacterium pelargi]